MVQNLEFMFIAYDFYCTKNMRQFGIAHEI